MLMHICFIQVSINAFEQGPEGHCTLIEYALVGHHMGLRFTPRVPWLTVENMFDTFDPMFHRVAERVLRGSGDIKVQFAIECRFRKMQVDAEGHVTYIVRDEWVSVKARLVKIPSDLLNEQTTNEFLTMIESMLVTVATGY